jgi:hypothetical protein
MPRQIYGIGESVGLEFETEQVLNNDAQRELSNSVYQTTHDASIESDFFVGNDNLIFKKSDLRRVQGSRVTIGTEIVSTPIDLETEEPDKMVMQLTKWLSEYGEPCQSSRAGIHIHIGLGATNLAMLKSSVQWGRHLEALFYHLAGNGYEFRGTKNDAAYCRPITRNGPPYLPSRSNFTKCFDIDDMMNATSTKQFWYLYGATTQGNTTRYVPHRYIWLNWYSLLAHGTLEFRPWNTTLNAHYIIAEMELCRLFTRAVIKGIPAPENEHSAFDIHSLGYNGIQRDLDSVAQMWDMSERTHKILSMIVKRTPLMTLDSSPLLSHLNYSMPWDGSYGYTPKTTSNARRPEIVTIHTLRGEPERN